MLLRFPAAAGRIDLPDQSGVTAVLSHQARPEILALDELADSFSASPVDESRHAGRASPGGEQGPRSVLRPG